MKLITYILLFLSISFGFSQKKAKEYPVMEFETTTINYGKITSEASGRRTFKFTNTGNVPLIINSVKGSCGCVVLKYPKKPIMPNEKGEIEIVYNVLKVGRISRTVTITANTKKSRIVLKIKGRVLKNK
ncbi:MAG: DUF1573 domain-containing protein [Flavobacteriaceae bacterium]